MEKSKKLTSPDEIKIYSNPFRLKILSLFDSTNTPLNVKNMADKLGEVPSKVHYHVKELEKIGVMEIVEKKERSGIVEKFYLPTAELFYIDNALRTKASNIYEEGQDDVFSMIMNTVNESIEDFRENATPNIDAGRLFSQLDCYLTPMETRELHDMCVQYIKGREKKKESLKFNFTLLTIQKFD